MLNESLSSRVCQKCTRLCPSRNGSGRIIVASTSAKTAVLAPRPTARMAMTTRGKAGCCRQRLSACLMSLVIIEFLLIVRERIREASSIAPAGFMQPPCSTPGVN